MQIVFILVTLMNTPVGPMKTTAEVIIMSKSMAECQFLVKQAKALVPPIGHMLLSAKCITRQSM